MESGSYTETKAGIKYSDKRCYALVVDVALSNPDEIEAVIITLRKVNIKTYSNRKYLKMNILLTSGSNDWTLRKTSIQGPTYFIF